jgi:dihydrodipicolinate synthase/N-acetylneuraminate lyase
MAVSSSIRNILARGVVIPAHPLAINSARKLDERRQAALTRYYCDAGVGGVAVGVHTTQFQIHEPSIGLLEPVLRIAAEEVREFESKRRVRLLKIAGICGLTDQAVREARLARDAGYDLGLLSLSAFPSATEATLLAHCRRIGDEIPLFGFYLQPAAGGRILSYRFWREFCELDAVAAIKIAPFNRYQTIDVIRAVAGSGRAGDIALYTGNDDNIVADLMTPFRLGGKTLEFAGGLLGQWAVWTRRAVELLDCVRAYKATPKADPRAILSGAAALTDANAAIFDVQNRFAGCIAGIQEVLRRAHLLEGRWCLDEKEDLSPGQLEEIDRIWVEYPHLRDDEFVQENLDRWLK